MVLKKVSKVKNVVDIKNVGKRKSSKLRQRLFRGMNGVMMGARVYMTNDGAVTIAGPGQPRPLNATRLLGYGDYNYSGATPYADVGRHIGSWFGYGSQGAAIGHAVGRLFGMGDYHANDGPINVNSIISGSSTQDVVPGLVSGGPPSGPGSIVIRRKEYIQDIVSSGTANTFLNSSFTINPGNSAMFPWLSAVAANYEQYRIRGLVFGFVSLSSDALNSVSTGLGYVAMATQYDVLDPVFTSKQSLENYILSQSCKPSRDQIHGVECDPGQNTLTELYVRTGSLPTGADQRMYDFGTFNIATAAPGTAVTLGELWVSYDIELFKPKLNLDGPTTGAPSLHVVRRSTGVTAMNLGTTAYVNNGSIVAVVNSTTVSYTNLSPGENYLFTASWQCSATISSVPSFTLSSGATGLSIQVSSSANDVNNINYSPATGTGTAFIYMLTFTATSNFVVLTVTPGAISSGNFGLDIFTSLLDSSIVA